MSYPVLPESSRDADENWKSEMPIIDQTRYLSRRNYGQLNHLHTHTQRLHLSDAGFGIKQSFRAHLLNVPSSEVTRHVIKHSPASATRMCSSFGRNSSFQPSISWKLR